MAVFNPESQGGAHHVPSLDSACSGIDAQHVALPVRHHLEDMGVPADEDVRSELVDQRLCSGGPTPRVAAYVHHQDLHPFDLKELIFGIFKAYVLAVAVAVDALQRLEFPDAVGEFEPSAEVAGMPYLIHSSEEVPESLGKYPMSIGYQAYVHVTELFEQRFYESGYVGDLHDADPVRNVVE